MSVRMALAKLAAAAAGGAMLGGGAVHVSEAPSKGEIHHVKPVKVKTTKPAKRIAKRPAKREIHRARRIVTTTTTKTCEPAPQMAMVPVP
ncbi:MAG: PEP-CTERM sorting domain-containing protein, partial [Novosphingobium sp.]